MTLFFPSHRIQPVRGRQIGGLQKWSYSATFTVLSADIQPMAPGRVQFVDGGRIGATFECWVESDVDIKEGDRIVDVDTGKKYSVRGVSVWEGAGMLDHKHIILVSQNA